MKVILAEKPSVARDIAAVVKATTKCQGYISGNGYAVTWAFGHLVGLAQMDTYSEELKKWSLETLPFFPEKFITQVGTAKGVLQQYKVIKKLFLKASEIIHAEDAAREGILIGRLIYDEIQKESNGGISSHVKHKRLWISSLTSSAIRNGLQNLKPESEFDNLAEEGKARSEADWILGLNATRAYSVKYKKLIVGRVKTPVLAEIVRRDRAIEHFTSKPFWNIETKVKETIFKSSISNFNKIEDAQELFDEIKPEEFVIESVTKKTKQEKPPLLFDLTSLQCELNGSKGLSSQDTLSALQKLYESKLATYPRTDSRYLSNDMYESCKTVLNKLSSIHPGINKLDIGSLRKGKTIFDDSKISDHHAVIPTGEIAHNLSGNEKTVYEAILTRFIAVFYPDCLKDQTAIVGKVKGYEFKASGSLVTEQGWREIESLASDKEIDSFSESEVLKHDPKVTEGKTTPPPKYSEKLLLKWMENSGKEIDDKDLKEILNKGGGIGTPATRASTIEALIKSGSVTRKSNKLISTHNGRQTIDRILTEEVKIPELTAKWELKLSDIGKGKYTRKEFISEVKEFTAKLVEDVKTTGEINTTKDVKRVLKVSSKSHSESKSVSVKQSVNDDSERKSASVNKRVNDDSGSMQKPVKQSVNNDSGSMQKPVKKSTVNESQVSNKKPKYVIKKDSRREPVCISPESADSLHNHSTDETFKAGKSQCFLKKGDLYFIEEKVTFEKCADSYIFEDILAARKVNHKVCAQKVIDGVFNRNSQQINNFLSMLPKRIEFRYKPNDLLAEVAAKSLQFYHNKSISPKPWEYTVSEAPETCYIIDNVSEEDDLDGKYFYLALNN